AVRVCLAGRDGNGAAGAGGVGGAGRVGRRVCVGGSVRSRCVDAAPKRPKLWRHGL
ncbi:MAG: luciferase, partial [uncultured Chloroflexi bacterium]